MEVQCFTSTSDDGPRDRNKMGGHGSVFCWFWGLPIFQLRTQQRHDRHFGMRPCFSHIFHVFSHELGEFSLNARQILLATPKNLWKSAAGASLAGDESPDDCKQKGWGILFEELSRGFYWVCDTNSLTFLNFTMIFRLTLFSDHISAAKRRTPGSSQRTWEEMPNQALVSLECCHLDAWKPGKWPQGLSRNSQAILPFQGGRPTCVAGGPFWCFFKLGCQCFRHDIPI